MQLRHLFSAGTIGALLFASAPYSSQAADIFTDTFNYPAGALAGNGPPPDSPAGQGAWMNLTGSPQVTAGGLSYGTLAADASKATISGFGGTIGNNAVAQMSQIGGANGGTVWVAFYINQGSGPASPGGFAVVSVGSSAADVNIGIGMLFDENIYGIDNNVGTPIERARTSVTPSSTVTWLVTKLDFDAGMEYIFVDPPMGSEPQVATAAASQAMTSAFQAAGINEALLVAGGNSASFNIGELRVGTEFADVSATTTVSLAASVPQVTAGTGEKGIFTLTRQGGELTTDLTVDYSVKGTAKPGVDYTALTGSKTIKAGKASVEIKVKPIGDLNGASKRTVKLTLVPEAAYTVGTAASMKVKILSGQ